MLRLWLLLLCVPSLVYNTLRPSIARIRGGNGLPDSVEPIRAMDDLALERRAHIDSPHELLQAAIAACPRGTRTLRASGAALPDEDSWEQSDAYEGAINSAEASVPSACE